MQPSVEISKQNDHICGRFTAMASPCEILLEMDCADADAIIHMAAQETLRIERKFSRYRNDNLMHAINNSDGRPVPIDSETHKLLMFADTCYRLSDGLFDVTSGVLRKLWRFDGSNVIPTQADVNALLPFIDWQQIKFDEDFVVVPAGFELDFGGIGKEYAVDKVAQLVHTLSPDHSALINFGGDLQVTQPRQHDKTWIIGVENPLEPGQAGKVLQIQSGGLATSGDTNRVIEHDGQRYGHILNPKTGYPVEFAPRSVTVAAQFCVQAGMLATLAMLHGKQAESFLNEQNVHYWCIR